MFVDIYDTVKKVIILYELGLIYINTLSVFKFLIY